MYFLEFLNNPCALWTIRIVAVAGVVSVMSIYFYKHKKYRKEHELEEEGGK